MLEMMNETYRTSILNLERGRMPARSGQRAALARVQSLQM
jgi:hypothetical protein